MKTTREIATNVLLAVRDIHDTAAENDDAWTNPASVEVVESAILAERERWKEARVPDELASLISGEASDLAYDIRNGYFQGDDLEKQIAKSISKFVAEALAAAAKGGKT